MTWIIPCSFPETIFQSSCAGEEPSRQAAASPVWARETYPRLGCASLSWPLAPPHSQQAPFIKDGSEKGSTFS